MQYNLLDIVLAIIYFFIVITIAKLVENRRKKEHPEFKYYTWGLFAKIFGGISVCLIYSFYYDGGDTIAYFQSAEKLSRLIFENPKAYFSILFGNLSLENYSAFNSITGWPYYYNDSQAFAVVRFTSPFALLGARSYLPTTILIAALNFSGIWRLYRLFIEKFPKMDLQLAIAILFMPSLIFWGSGVLKDSFTICAAGCFFYSYYKIIMKRQKAFFYVITIIISSYVLIAIKPYIFFSLVIGLVVWYTAELINKIKRTFLKTIISPFIIILIWGLGSVLVIYFGNLVGGAYSDINILVEKAIVTQEDLKMAYYEGNSFDIGVISPTVAGILSKFPQAITAGLLRPFIWESNNPVMFLAGLENFFLLILLFIILIRVGPFSIIKFTSSESLLVFSIVFVLTFGFSIGLSTSNFGSLVRYKIPLIPFFVSYLFIIIKKKNLERKASSG